MKFRFSGKLMVGVSLEIEAEDEEAALEIAEAIEASAYVGHGSMSGLVGLSSDSRAVQGTRFFTEDCFPEWDDVEEL